MYRTMLSHLHIKSLLRCRCEDRSDVKKKLNNIAVFISSLKRNKNYIRTTQYSKNTSSVKLPVKHIVTSTQQKPTQAWHAFLPRSACQFDIFFSHVCDLPVAWARDTQKKSRAKYLLPERENLKIWPKYCYFKMPVRHLGFYLRPQQANQRVLH